jgi:hypothetical protein
MSQIPVHSRRIWNGINFEWQRQIHSMFHKSRFSLAASTIESLFLVRTWYPLSGTSHAVVSSKGIDADKFESSRQRMKRSYVYFVQAGVIQRWYWLRIETLLTHIFVCGTMVNQLTSYCTAWGYLCHRWPVRHSWFPRNERSNQPSNSHNPLTTWRNFSSGTASTCSLDDHSNYPMSGYS